MLYWKLGFTTKHKITLIIFQNLLIQSWQIKTWAIGFLLRTVRSMKYSYHQSANWCLSIISITVWTHSPFINSNHLLDCLPLWKAHQSFEGLEIKKKCSNQSHDLDLIKHFCFGNFYIIYLIFQLSLWHIYTLNHCM